MVPPSLTITFYFSSTYNLFFRKKGWLISILYILLAFSCFCTFDDMGPCSLEPVPCLPAQNAGHKHTHTHTHTHTIQLSQLWEGVQVENSLTSLFESQFFFSVLRVVLDALPKYGGYSISIHLILSWESVKHMFCDMRHLNSHYLIFHP